MRDLSEEDPREVEAGKWGLNYIGLDGNIACMVHDPPHCTISLP